MLVEKVPEAPTPWEEMSLSAQDEFQGKIQKKGSLEGYMRSECLRK